GQLLARPRGHQGARGITVRPRPWPPVTPRPGPADNRLCPQLVKHENLLEKMMAVWEFPCPEPIDANVSLASGTVLVNAEPVEGNVVRVVVARGRSFDADDQAVDDVAVEFADRQLVVSEESRRGFAWRSKELHIKIWMPTGSRLAVQAASADVKCSGEYGATDIHTASGRVDVQTVHGPVEITAMSGDL